MNKFTYAFVGLMLVGGGCSTAVDETQEDTEVVEGTQEDTQDDSTQNETMTYEFPGTLAADQIEGKQIRLTTDKGDIVFTLFADTAPNTVSNFVYLAGEGYYDGLTFHRREEGFVIQGGDPNGTGTGGPGYKFADELGDDREYTRGTVAMANAGPNTNGSQFFVMLDDVALPHLYTIFGEVTEGMDVVDAIAVGDVMTTVAIEEKVVAGK
jgi:cyclophilin family peptidyl-prolyl cis-trans isomerase